MPLRVIVVLAALAAACAPTPQAWEDTFTGDGEDAFLLDDDFTCLGDAHWADVGGTRVTNVLGKQEAAEAVARAPSAGARFPVGTIVQLLPGEAMVKRGAGFAPETDDWEFLVLDVGTGRTVITARGTTEVGNPGGTCLSCHSAARAFDDVCFTNDRCAPLPFFIDTDVDPTTDDPRCNVRR